MFYLTSDITIGNFRFSGVHEVHIKRSIHSYADSATIKLPAKAQVSMQGKTATNDIVTGKQFTDGDPVTIKLGYGDLPITEFQGFVDSKDKGIPLEIKCEGNSWLLKRKTITRTWASVTVDALLKAVLDGTGIKYTCTVSTVLHNVVISNQTIAEVLDTILKFTDNNLCIFFVQPGMLWCGIIYTPCAQGTDQFKLGAIQCRLGYNVLKDNSLKQRLPQDDPGTHTYVKKTTNGTPLRGQSQQAQNAVREYKKTLNNVGDTASLKQLAQEHQYAENYTGYEGSLTAFLQPYCIPGYLVQVVDDDYPELNGQYLAESVDITFGTGGARRRIDIGAAMGFASKK